MKVLGDVVAGGLVAGTCGGLLFGTLKRERVTMRRGGLFVSQRITF